MTKFSFLEKTDKDTEVMAFNWDGFIDEHVDEFGTTSADFYNGPEDKIQGMIFAVINKLLDLETFKGRDYIAIKFSDIRMADMIQRWDFQDYQDRVQYMVHHNFEWVILRIGRNDN